MKQCKQSNAGLTLIEVLIALAILSIALTAIIHSTSQNIKSTVYLQNKMIAVWVGTEVMNEIRAGVLKPVDGRLTQETEMLGQTWSWQATLNPTPNPKIKEIHVEVLQPPNDKKLVQLMSYIYVAAN